MLLFVHMSVYVHYMCVDAHGVQRQRRIPGAGELPWVLGNKTEVSGRVADAPNR